VRYVSISPDVVVISSLADVEAGDGTTHIKTPREGKAEIAREREEAVFGLLMAQ